MADTYFSKRDIQNILFAIGIKQKEKWDDNKTWRKIRRTDRSNGYHGNVEVVIGDDRQLRYEGMEFFKKRKMPPYHKRKCYKAKEVRMNFFPNTSQRSKEIRNNANRSMKKSIRQQYKKELRIEIENLNEYETI